MYLQTLRGSTDGLFKKPAIELKLKHYLFVMFRIDLP